MRLRTNLPQNALLVVDQAYAEFSDAEHNPAEIFAMTQRGDTVITRTFSKAYGLAGARVGWVCAPPEIGAELRKLLNPNNVSIPSQAAAAAAMRDQAHMREVVAKTTHIRDAFGEGCRALGLTVPQSHTNFILLRFASVDQAQRADAALRAEHLLMRGMGGYGLGDCLRATICAPDVMKRARDVLEGVLK